LVGNGFDLSHGYKTSYNDFIQNYLCNALNHFISGNCHDDLLLRIGSEDRRDIKEVVTTLSRALEIIDVLIRKKNIIEFKSALFKEMIFSVKSNKWVDIEIQYFSYLRRFKHASNNDKDGIIKINLEFDFIKNELEKHIINVTGTSVYWDFVELPSQVMENWCYEPEALALFAKHYETGEIIPQEYVEKIKESASFQEGMATMRQISFGLLDMTYHGKPQTIDDVKNFEEKAFENTKLYPDVAENCMSTSFSHIFQGGYSSGYYSYKWAEVLDADAFAYFQEKGIFDKEVATKFKENVLSKGGTEHPMTLYKKFRGQEPKPEALLKRAGLI
jgi:hypothetical protein